MHQQQTPGAFWIELFLLVIAAITLPLAGIFFLNVYLGDWVNNLSRTEVVFYWTLGIVASGMSCHQVRQMFQERSRRKKAASPPRPVRTPRAITAPPKTRRPWREIIAEETRSAEKLAEKRRREQRLYR